MSKVAPKIILTEKQKSILSKFATSRNLSKSTSCRSKIILYSESGMSNKDISVIVSLTRKNVGLWRKKWIKNMDVLLNMEKEEDNHKYINKIKEVLSDNERSGTPAKFSAEAICQIISVACEAPEDSENPLSHWSRSSLRLEVIKRGIVEDISPAHLGRFLKSGKYKTSQSRGMDSHTY
jgi:putative transposase